MNDRVEQLIEQLERPGDDESPDAIVRHCEWLADASDEEIEQLLDYFLGQAVDSTVMANERNLENILVRLVERLRPKDDHRADPLESSLCDRIFQLYNTLPQDSRARGYLLRALAWQPDEMSARRLTELIVTSPPPAAEVAAVGLAPLFQRSAAPVEILFPRLLDAIQHRSVAGMVLDLANYLSRSGRISPHPATDRAESLSKLLGQVVGHLGALEDKVSAAGVAADKEVPQQVADSIALTVSLCDALALTGSQHAIGPLYQAMKLRHRRVRVESAAAIVRLGGEAEKEAGEAVLLELAEEPVVRLRVLAYAEELGLGEKIDPKHVTPTARAEAELACWLSEPMQFGVAPSTVKILDHRIQYWPGYEDPIDCFLFRYTFNMPAGEYVNVGLAGPTTHTFAADLSELPIDDIYAAFAGWHAEHADLQQVSIDRLSPAAQADVARLERRLRDNGFIEIEPLELGLFFGEQVLISSAKRGGVAGTAIADANHVHWAPTEGSHPLLPDDAYRIYKGRHLLRSFNPEEEGEGSKE